MKTDDLIKQLAGDLRPTKQAPSEKMFALRFMLLSMVVLAAGLVVFHARPDIALKLTLPSFLAVLLPPAFVLLLCLPLVSRESRPGARRGRMLNVTLLTVPVALLVMVLFSHLQLTTTETISGLDGAGVKCCVLVLLLSLVPGSALVYFVRKQAPVRLQVVGVLIALASVSVGELCVTLHCPIDNTVHVALWHFVLPFLAVYILGTFVIPRLIRW